MSFDPFGPSGPPQSPFPPSGPGLPPAQSPYTYSTPARDRVQLPAIFLLVVAVLNLLIGLYTAFETTRAVVVPADKLYADALENADKLGEAFPTMKQQVVETLEKQTPQGLKNQVMLQFGIPTVIIFLTSLLLIAGGIRMLQLRSFGLCVLASIIAATPCVSPMGCCCMGNIAGIWALVVLLAPDVRTAFQ